jgi:hypothetical protein
MALKCDECDFIGKNEKSLRLHKIKKHKKKWAIQLIQMF